MHCLSARMEYRFDDRELKARIDRPVYCTLIDELNLHEDLVNYANESYLRETGKRVSHERFH